jgi:hypothetical protein
MTSHGHQNMQRHYTGYRGKPIQQCHVPATGHCRYPPVLLLQTDKNYYYYYYYYYLYFTSCGKQFPDAASCSRVIKTNCRTALLSDDSGAIYRQQAVR